MINLNRQTFNPCCELVYNALLNLQTDVRYNFYFNHKSGTNVKQNFLNCVDCFYEDESAISENTDEYR